MGEICLLCDKGDTKLSWNKDNIDDVRSAEKMFDDLVINKNYLAFKVSKNNRKTDKRLYSFEASAERIVLVPPVRGG